MADFEKLAAALAKAVGENDEDQDVSVWIDSGFAPLNKAISGRFDGGWPGGRIVEIYGPESSGKTWLATQAMISAQRMGGVAGFHDHERSFKQSLAVKLGLDVTPGRWVYKKPKSFEESLSLFAKAVREIRAARVIPAEAPIVWVFDSLASMIPKQMLDKDLTEQNMNDTTALARLTSFSMKIVASICEEFNVLAIFLNQIRVKPGVLYGDPTTTPGGNAPKFYASVRLQLGATRLMKEEGGEKVMVGSEVSARCYKNKVNRPFLRATFRFMFNEDGSGRFDLAGSLLDFAAQKGILEASGKPQRITWTDGKSYLRSQLLKKIEEENLVGELHALILASDAEVDEDAEENPDGLDEAVVATEAT